MKFGLPQLVRFNAREGSYSLVTPREVFDSQITATDAEADLLIKYFQRHNETIHVGRVGTNPQAALKTFLLFPSGDPIKLNLVFPKPEKGELRLYIAQRRGFMPKEGQVWFLFLDKEDRLWIGKMHEAEWRQFNSRGTEDPDSHFLLQDPPTSSYISTLHTPQEPHRPSEIVAPTIEESTEILLENPAVAERRIRERFRGRSTRDPEIAKRCLERAKYVCEYSAQHCSFRGRATGCAYMESHHVIPMEFQYTFLERNMNLDKLDNVCCICPMCHSAIHHADAEIARSILSKLYDLRNLEKTYAVSKLELFQMYSVEEIVREDDPVITTDAYQY